MSPDDPVPPIAKHDPMPDETGRTLRKSVAVLGCILLVAFLIVHFVKSSHETAVAKETGDAASAPPPVNVVKVEQAPRTFALKLPGETAAWFESTIFSRVDGYVAKWYVDIGDAVKKGQVLATIETPELDAQLSSSRAKLQAAQAVVIARKADADFAQTTYARWRDSPKGVVSEQEREEKKAGYDSAVAQLSAAEAQVMIDRADVERYTVLTGFKQVIAPYDGKIIERRIDIGNLVAAGSSSNTTLLYKMAQSNPMRIFVDVPQSAAGDLKNGVAARITASNISGHAIEGTVTRTAGAIDPRARTIRVEVDVSNANQLLVPGMYVDVTFDIPTQGLLQVPAAALIFHSTGPQVAIVDGKEHVSFHSVNIVRDDGRTVLIDSGAAAGDQVALNIGAQVADGQLVQINEPQAADANGPVPKK